MSKNDLKLTSHRIDENHWWYEEPGGIVVLADKTEPGGPTTMVIIPWKDVRLALKRKDKVAAATRVK